MKYELYEVGGKIRDEFLGLRSKDIDYTVVILGRDQYPIDEVFENFVEQIESEGYQVFVTTPDCFTVRAKFPKDHVHSGQDADFVLARKELGYIKGTRQPEVVLGTLEDDLLRRDFTLNALAKDIEGNIIDLYNGQKDLQDRILRTPTDAVVSFNDDPLRILRAMRFSITKGFGFSDEIVNAIELFDDSKLLVVSVERMQVELHKMFMHDTERSLQLLWWLQQRNYMLYERIIQSGIRLEPTLKK